MGTPLAPAGTFSCSFPGDFFGDAGDTQTDTVTVTGEDARGIVVTDDDDAIVTLDDVLPTITVDKTATPLSLPEPGGVFTFNVVVTNNSVEQVTITALTDDTYPNIATLGTCTTAVGTPLAASPGPGNTYSCSFPGSFTGVGGDAQTDTVTATAVDNEGNSASDTDPATVTITDELPVITVDKTATPLTRPEPGGQFTFNVLITNTSPETITILTLTDDVYDNIATQGTCTNAVNTVLQPSPGPGNTYSCSFTGDFTGDAGDAQTDTVTATGVDDDGDPVTADDDAVVTLTDVLPTISVDKTATPLTRPEPGGSFTFNVVVTNNSVEPVTITSLTDDVYDNIATQGTCTNAVNTVLQPSPGPGNTYSCSFTGDFFGGPGASQIDTVTATAVDDDQNPATATDDATVTITNLVPTILVDKSASPGSRPEPGGTFTFNVVVTNTGPEALTITSLVDNVYPNITTRPGSTCNTAIGTVLQPGASYNCSFTGDFTGSAGRAKPTPSP